MRAINARAKKTMDILTANCSEHIGDHDKFHTKPFMDVVVEYIDQCELGTMFSIAHYYKQNGDLMRDPEMCFIRGGDGEYYPYYYRVDGLGTEQNALWYEDCKLKGYDSAMQKEHTIFANMWMQNIKRQQESVR
ncbi:MAG: hypothetical protein IMF19_14255 [Proteobacteria bacterium]|nr:hypothetical protein [Pseudomonadota bacterium]